ncbi:3-oxoacyl-[acyl-carrier-protein] synthase 3 A, chloroplastic-like protein [Tanacetum coccineum]
MNISSSTGVNSFGSTSLVIERISCSRASTKSRVPKLITKGCKLVGCGSALPKRQFSNDDLAKIIDTNDEWISSRTGIRNRRILTDNETLTGLAVEAAQKALQMAEVEADDVDLILFCSSTPEDLFGGAPEVQKLLSKRNPPAYDIRAACSGFLLGLVSASCHIRGGGFKNVLVIGADSISRYVDWTDRSTCILFGDAAGAVLIQACASDEDGLFSFDLHTDGDGSRYLYAGIKQNKTNDSIVGTSDLGIYATDTAISHLQMNGKQIFRFVVNAVPQSIEASLAKSGHKLSEIDWLLIHQANQRIIDSVATKLDFPKERVISNLKNYGNTSAASIPLALDEAVRSGKVKKGETIMTAGFGAGLTWGSALVRWG